MKLTKSAIDRLTFDPARGKKHIVWDDELRGFGVRVWPSGKKVFVVFYRTRAGRQRLLTLGPYGVLTLEQARTRAKVVLVEALDGKDPLAQRRRFAASETVADLCELYISRHAKPHNKLWEREEDWLETYVVPKIGTLKVLDVVEEDLARIHRELGEAGKRSLANRVLNICQAAWNKAVRWGVQVNEKHPNPARFIERYPESKRQRYVTEDEMPRLGAAIAAESDVFLKALIWGYLLTGMRKTELRTIRWDQVDLKRRWLTQPDTKTGVPLQLPLPMPLVAILEQLPRFVDEPHVFAGKFPGRPLKPDKGWDRIRKRAKLDDVRIHDLRHTVASWLVNNGTSLEVIAGTLNHASTQMTQRYAHLSKAPIAVALDGNARRMLAAAEPPAHQEPVVDAEATEA